MTGKELTQLIQTKKLEDYTFKCLIIQSYGEGELMDIQLCDMEINHQDKTVEIF